ncbi:MAG: hypothetical protein A2583_15155 [Bdellovibrionales bacterium RIFOXYD1_FULL_53_11]|nr:MAG: hypothetical protein A2583_15155 [Bdellovibrionales bacterium RIFOXYD1_FULL_53_11]
MLRKILPRCLVEDRFARWLLIGGFAYSLFFTQGIPLWDDDFTSWLWKVKDTSWWRYLFEIISPVSTQPQHWGFNERPLECLVLRTFYLISGYESWSYFLYRDVMYGALAVMIYLWGVRLTRGGPNGKLAVFAAAVFFIFAPGVMAANLIHADFATTAEFLFLLVTYVIWDQVEKTPADWRGRPDFKNPEQRAWLKRWVGIALLTYLTYKSKADLKMIPLILGAYVVLLPERRKQWMFFAVPVAVMLFLAVPWGPGIFTRLPPFVPGSKGSEINWMWQPASVGRLWEFLWSSQPYSFFPHLRSATLSLSGVLGPFLLAVMVVFLGWKAEAIDKIPWRQLSKPGDRARTFFVIWLVFVLAAVCALPAINYIFRIRYGILTMVPVAALLAWVFGLFVEAAPGLNKWLVRAVVAVFVLQCGVNFWRSVTYRRDMGQVIVASDQVYEHARKTIVNGRLALLPDFRPYDYRPDAGPLFEKKVWLKSNEDLEKNHKPFETYVISWNPTLWDQLELVAHFSGCRSTTLFDIMFPCKTGSGTNLMRFIGRDPLYTKGEELRAKGRAQEAMAAHSEYLARYPMSMAGHFVTGLLAYQLKQWDRVLASYGVLEKHFPDHLSILYNHALGLMEVGRFNDAIRRLEFVLARDGANYGALLNLYIAQRKSGNLKGARETLIRTKRMYPTNMDIDKWLKELG